GDFTKKAAELLERIALAAERSPERLAHWRSAFLSTARVTASGLIAAATATAFKTEALDLLHYADVDHGGHHVLDQRCKRRNHSSLFHRFRGSGGSRSGLRLFSGLG